jgi:hypothetical protein
MGSIVSVEANHSEKYHRGASGHSELTIRRMAIDYRVDFIEAGRE